MGSPGSFDVFISYYQDDRASAERLASQLVELGVHPWLDIWSMTPGELVQEAIEEALDQCPCAIILLGRHGTGPWQHEEMRLALQRRVEQSGHRTRPFRVLPVFLPDTDSSDTKLMPAFLRRSYRDASTAVDFSQGMDNDEMLLRLVAGIRGVPPGPGNRTLRPAAELAGDSSTTHGGEYPSARPTIINYHNFDLRLTSLSSNELSAEVLSSPAGESHATVAIGDLHSFRLDTDEAMDLSAASEAIGQALLPGPVRERFAVSLALASQDKAGLRLRLRVDNPELGIVPWELASIDGDFLSLRLRTPMVRYMPVGRVPTPLETRGRMNILGVASSPLDLGQLNVLSEQRLISTALGELVKSQRVSITWLPAATTQQLQANLHRDFHLLHYAGHASYDSQRHEGFLWFQGAGGRSAPVSATWLATLIQDSLIRFVFLNACESGGDAGRLAEVLVSRGVPAVLAMQTTVSDETAAAFAAGFYRALSDGWPVDAATVEGRREIVNAMRNDLRPPEWAKPILYMRAPDGKLFG